MTQVNVVSTLTHLDASTHDSNMPTRLVKTWTAVSDSNLIVE